MATKKKKTKKKAPAKRYGPRMIVYKKIKARNWPEDFFIVKMAIPSTAKRVLGDRDANMIFYRKCRAEFADVLEIRPMNMHTEKLGSRLKKGTKVRHTGFFNAKPLEYVVGKRVFPSAYDESNHGCVPGIHFFRDLSDAKAYKG